MYDAIYSLNLALNLQHPGFKVDVVPLEAEQLAPSQSGGQIEVVEFKHAGFLRLPEEVGQLFRRQHLHLSVLFLWQTTAFRGIDGQQPFHNRFLASGVDYRVNIPHRLAAESFGLTFGFRSIITSIA